MKILLTLAALALTLTVTGCEAESLATEAADLRTELAGLPGVDTAALAYTEPVPLDSGKLDVQVQMAPDAGSDQVTRVTEVAYAAFAGTHVQEEADLTVTFPGGTLHLRAFEPEASLAAVSAATVTGLSAPEPGGSVEVDLMTQDVKRGDHVRATYVVGLPDGTDADDVLPALDALALQHDDSRLVGWGVRAADGTGLTYDRGFPTAELRTRWEELRSPVLPTLVRGAGDGWVFVEAYVGPDQDLRDEGVRRALDEVAHDQLRALRGAPVWSYQVSQGSRVVVMIDRGMCVASSESAWDRELEAWSARVGGGC